MKIPTRPALFVLFALLAAPSVAAQGVSAAARADDWTAKARDLARTGRFEEACIDFSKSLAAEERLDTLLDLADCYEHTGRLATAGAKFDEAVTWARRLADLRRTAYARARVEALRGKYASVVVTVREIVAGYTVRIDDTVVSESSYNTAIPVDPGAHKLEVSAPGFRTWTADLDAVNGLSQAVVPELVATNGASPGPVRVVRHPVAPAPSPGTPANDPLAPSPPPPEPGMSGARILGWASIGLGGAAVVTSGVLGLVAISKKSIVDASCPDHVCNATGTEALNDGRTAAAYSTGFAVGGAAVLGIGAALMLVPPATKSRADRTHFSIGLGSVTFGADFDVE
jgi:serine/threonine-protein kinase